MSSQSLLVDHSTAGSVSSLRGTGRPANRHQEACAPSRCRCSRHRSRVCYVGSRGEWHGSNSLGLSTEDWRHACSREDHGRRPDPPGVRRILQIAALRRRSAVTVPGTVLRARPRSEPRCTKNAWRCGREPPAINRVAEALPHPASPAPSPSVRAGWAIRCAQNYAVPCRGRFWLHRQIARSRRDNRE